MYKDGKHILSKYWQTWKLNQPDLTQYQRSVLIGMILSDACIIKTNKYPYVKFEQGYLQKEFVENLFDIFKTHSFSEEISIRYKKNNDKIHSYWFKTFSHPTFELEYDLFYNNNCKDKTIKSNLITNHVDEISLAYWIMGDGYFHKRDKIYSLHTEGFTYNECLIISIELNKKYNLNSSVKLAKETSTRKLYKIVFTARDSSIISNLIKPYILPIFKYKIL